MITGDLTKAEITAEMGRRAALTPIERFAEDWPKLSAEARAEAAQRVGLATVGLKVEARSRADRYGEHRGPGAMPGRAAREARTSRALAVLERFARDLCNAADEEIDE